MNSLRKLLWPFSVLYDGITHLRNLAFDKGKLPASSYPLAVINVGNLSTGGTGKSPMVEYLLRLLTNRNTGVVSRGYGRKTKGLIASSVKHTAKDIGDEPAQFKRNFPDVPLVVSESRVRGIEHLLKQYPHTEAIVLDDAYQHRYVKAGFNLLLSSFAHPFYKDQLLPAGNLRENRKGAARAHAVVVTKCPADLSKALAESIKDQIRAYSTAPVFFSHVVYSKPVNAFGRSLSGHTEIILLTGIARPEPLLAHLSETLHIKQHLKFKDHHNFSERDLQKINHLLSQKDACILTTQKDFMRLKNALKKEAIEKLFVVPIFVRFLFGQEDEFNNLILNYIEDC